MSTPSIQTLITQAQQVLNLKSSNEIRATLAAVLANANVGTPLNPNLTTQQLWDEFYEIVRQPSDDIMSIITDQMMRMVFSPPAPGGAGADKQVIFNDGGVLAGDTKFLWDKNANQLDVDGPVVITGDLTVDTNVLKVDTTNNRVGIGTASPGAELEVYKNTNGLNRVFVNNPSTGASAYSSIDLTTGTTGGKILQLGSGYSGSYPYITGSTVIQNDSVGGVTLHSVGPYPIYFGTNNTQRMQIDSSGNVGIGVTPSAWLSSLSALQVKGVNGLYGAGSSELGSVQNCFYNASSQWIYGTTAAAGKYAISSGVHQWYNAPSGTAGNAITFTQAMTLDASGALLVGCTTAPNPGAATTSSGFSLNGDGNNAYISAKIDNSSCGYFRRDGTDGVVLNFYKANNSAGTISVTPTVCTFNSVSDYRLKEAVKPITSGLARVNALKPASYKWKLNGSDGEGFLAHEISEVVPIAVTGEKDAVNADGSIDAQAIDMSRIVPILVAAIQELTAEVNALKNA